METSDLKKRRNWPFIENGNSSQKTSRYRHQKLNISKGVRRNGQSQFTQEEIKKKDLKSKQVTDVKMIEIKSETI